MSEVAIKAEGLTKQYFIGSRQRQHDTVRDLLADVLATPFRRAANLLRGRATGAADLDRSIFALKDVSFEVARGEVLGIIGRNGAGKSTLLKILSRITEPTAGHAEIHGRIGSLLEVGTGFHPELTGRENIYLNGAILGMSRTDLDRQFDEIVGFAEVDEFIDTPVKHYSSGMYLRLAFAVAAHLEPETLLVDEVLAVGDVKFQRKCIGKMEDVANEGRTVLFVSHNLGSIRQLCDTCILLHGGRIRARGTPDEVIRRYVTAGAQSSNADVTPDRTSQRSGTGEGRIGRCSVLNAAGVNDSCLGIGEPFRLRLEISLSAGKDPIVAGFEVKQMDGLQVLNLRSDGQGISFELDGASERHVIEIEVPGLPLYPGTYAIEPWFAFKNGRRIDHLHEALTVSFEPRGHFESERMIQSGRGVVLVDCQWQLEKTETT
ncbi:MAG: ABC transporter ATP-binding protein [bacterium]|nr:ABC transporter ATP-binding protein [bacterium]